MRKRDIVSKYSFLIDFLVRISKVLPKGFYLSLLKLVRSHDNYFAMFIRYICLKNCAKSCGNNIAIFSNVYLFNIHNLEIGDNVSVHPLCYIDASGGISIGDDVSIAHNTTILSEEHNYSDLLTNIKDQGCTRTETIIDKNVWIGSGSRILAGSHVKSGTIVGAGAVVKGYLKENSIFGGVPAKLIKKR